MFDDSDNNNFANDFEYSRWGLKLLEMWKNFNPSDPFANAPDFSKNMFETFTEIYMKSMKNNPFFDKTRGEDSQNSNPFSNKNNPNDMQQMFVEINKIYVCMIQTIMYMQQKYLCQMVKNFGDMEKWKKNNGYKNKGPAKPETQQNPAEEDVFSTQTANHFEAVSNTIMQANNEICKKFSNVFAFPGKAKNSETTERNKSTGNNKMNNGYQHFYNPEDDLF